VRVAGGTLAGVPVGTGVTFLVHTVVREDAIDLYGFPTASELNFFKLLTSVSGIGPKTALGIINLAEVPTLARAIARGDASALTKVFGIGKKSAERIVVDLRDKVIGGIEQGPLISLGVHDHDAEVLEALVSLGYSAAEARAALKEIPASVAEMRGRLSAALQYLGGANIPTKIA